MRLKNVKCEAAVALSPLIALNTSGAQPTRELLLDSRPKRVSGIDPTCVKIRLEVCLCGGLRKWGRQSGHNPGN